MSAIVVSRSVRVKPEDFISAIWSGEEWSATWAPTLDFIVDYDDGEHQALRLRIDWQGKPIELSVMRFRESATHVEFFCPRPPDGLTRQTGTWRAETDDNGDCALIATRNVGLARMAAERDEVYSEREAQFCTTLSERLHLILRAFATELKGENR